MLPGPLRRCLRLRRIRQPRPPRLRSRCRLRLPGPPPRPARSPRLRQPRLAPRSPHLRLRQPRPAPRSLRPRRRRSAPWSRRSRSRPPRSLARTLSGAASSAGAASALSAAGAASVGGFGSGRGGVGRGCKLADAGGLPQNGAGELSDGLHGQGLKLIRNPERRPRSARPQTIFATIFLWLGELSSSLFRTRPGASCNHRRRSA